MIIKRQNMSENNWNHFKIVPKGHNNCQLSTFNCQFGEATKYQFSALLPQADARFLNQKTGGVRERTPPVKTVSEQRV